MMARHRDELNHNTVFVSNAQQLSVLFFQDNVELKQKRCTFIYIITAMYTLTLFLRAQMLQ